MSDSMRTPHIFLSYTPSLFQEIVPLIEGLLSLPIKLSLAETFKEHVDACINKNCIKKATIEYATEAKNADIILYINNDTESLKEYCFEGVVPVIAEKIAQEKGVEAFNPIEERGCCFTFKEFNQWTIFAAVIRALETYRFPYDWKNVKNACKNEHN